MNILLDTHILLWLLFDDKKLSNTCKNILRGQDTYTYFSVISLWEIAIKHDKYPETFPYDAEIIYKLAKQSGLQLLSLSPENIFMIRTLTRIESAKAHHDPFDKIMISQAKSETMQFITHDKLLLGYNESCVLWV